MVATRDPCGVITTCLKASFGQPPCETYIGTGGFCAVWLLRTWPHHYATSARSPQQWVAVL